MAKEYTFRGKTIEEIQKLSQEEFLKLVPARARRSLKRGKNKPVQKKIAKALEEKNKGKRSKPIRTHKRDTIITPEMVGLSFAVYNGKEFETRDIIPEMLGHYLGEMALTRKRLKHGKAGIGATRSSTAVATRK